jgi:DDE superfamily endonuclease
MTAGPGRSCWTGGGPAPQELLDDREHAGDPSPDGMGAPAPRAVRDEDKVRDDVRDDVVEHLARTRRVLVIDETGDLKKGAGTVGVQRQYTGTAGLIENAQVAVYLVDAAAPGTRRSTGSCTWARGRL